MRIGFDAKRLFVNNTGLGNYSRTLVENLHRFHPEHDLYLYAPRLVRNDRTEVFFESGYRLRSPLGPAKMGWRSFGMTHDLRKDGIELYHGLSHELPFNLEKSKIPSVVTIHDLLYKYFPMDFPLIDRWVYEKKFSAACSKADRIIAISEATRTDIMEHFGIQPQRIQVIYQTIHPIFRHTPAMETISNVREKYNLPAEFILYVGSIIRRKNLEVLIKALDLMPPKKRLPLIIVGNGKIYLDYIEQLIDDLKLHHNIIRIKNPSLDEINIFYRLASISVYPSLMEGFGLPVLESIACGTPVITTRRSSLVEAGGKVAYYIDGGDEEELAALMMQKIGTKESFGENIEVQRHLAQFYPERLTEQLDNLYKEVKSGR
ncbi:MAG: glycosyltransferase family 4 protein [Saprospiraceae bacterium]|nr:glycosyltransferase family 4 protein [Candidatus Parvibacillus calidus]